MARVMIGWVLVWIVAVLARVEHAAALLAVGFGRDRPKAAEMDRVELDRAA